MFPGKVMYKEMWQQKLYQSTVWDKQMFHMERCEGLMSGRKRCSEERLSGEAWC